MSAVSPYVTGRGQILANGLNWGTQIYGVSPDFPVIRSWRVGEGVFFEDPEVVSSAKVAVVGKTIIDNLFPDSDAASVIPWTFPLGDVSGVFMSACASIQRQPMDCFRRW